MMDASNSARISTAIGQVDVVVGGSQEGKLYGDQLAELYESDFADPPLRGTTLFSKERFLKKLFEDYVKAPNFKIVILWKGDKVIGFVYGCSLPPETIWWKGIEESLPEGFAEEDGHRTLALIDIVVKKDLRGQGLGGQLHARLLEGRNEKRVTLLSPQDLQPAHSIWQHWGYQKIGTTGQTKSGAVMDVFVRQLIEKEINS
jgi:GNAT superfamily N-acetyltransferase